MLLLVEIMVLLRQCLYVSLTFLLQVLAYYEEYFNIPFPLPKMDMIAIPNFISGAMENWGLITYRESRLLYQGRQRPTLILITTVCLKH